MGFCQVGESTLKNSSLLGCDPASCSFPFHEDLQLHNFMVAATKTAFRLLIPGQSFLVCKDEISEGYLLPPVPSPRGHQKSYH